MYGTLVRMTVTGSIVPVEPQFHILADEKGAGLVDCQNAMPLLVRRLHRCAGTRRTNGLEMVQKRFGFRQDPSQLVAYIPGSTGQSGAPVEAILASEQSSRPRQNQGEHDVYASNFRDIQDASTR